MLYTIYILAILFAIWFVGNLIYAVSKSK